MAIVAQGQSQLVNLGPNDAIKVSTPGEAYVDHLSGTPESPYASTRLIKNTEPKVFGPYGVNSQLRVRATEGTASFESFSSPQPAQVVDSANGLSYLPGAESTPNLSYFNSYISGIAGGAWATAVTAGSAKVALVGHSIAQGPNQSYYGASFYKLLKRALGTAFPGVTLTTRNYGIGGTRAAQFTGVPPAGGLIAQTHTVYREFWENDSLAASSPAGAWADKVAAFGPDLLFLMFDLNETVWGHAEFFSAMGAMINNIKLGARWAAKRPQIVLVTSHTGTFDPDEVRRCHMVLRGLAKKYNLPLLDAGRVWDIIHTGVDPVSLVYNVQGEIGFKGRVTSATVLPSEYYHSAIGVAYSPTGNTVRDQTSGPFRFYRKHPHADGAVQGSMILLGSNGVASLFYRANPDDPLYASGTGAQYELRISTDTAQVYKWVGGTAVAITGATGTLPFTIGTNSQYQLRVEYAGAEHRVSIQTPGNGRLEFEFIDGSILTPGNSGYGATGGYCDVGDRATAGVSTGSVLEWWEPLPVASQNYSADVLVGPANDWSSNPDSLGGNAINHLTMLGTKLVYEPAIGQVMRQLQV